MPRQRSKKTSASRKIEHAAAPVIERENVHIESDSEQSQISEKDEDEDELERLVLGDGVTFKEQLGMDIEVDTSQSNEFVENREGEEEDAGLENIDDSDVIYPPPNLQAIDANSYPAVLP